MGVKMQHTKIKMQNLKVSSNRPLGLLEVKSQTSEKENLKLRKVEISGSILAANFNNLENNIKIAENAGMDIIHLDIMDGHFVPNLTFGVFLMRDLRKITKLSFEAHLMVEMAENYLEELKNYNCERIIVHYEKEIHLFRIINKIKENGALAGLALNPSTALSNLESIINDLDLLLIMSVNPGFGGQKFIESSLQKLKQAQQFKIKNPKLKIGIDGGINTKKLTEVINAGADFVIAASALFLPEEKIKENVQGFVKIINKM